MKKIILLITLAISALTASAQNWTSFNSFGFQRKINGTDTTYRVLGAGVNTPYLYLKSDWSMKQLLDGKANLVGGNTFTGNQIIQDQQPNLEIKSTLLNQSFKLGYAGDFGSAFTINNHQGKRLFTLTNPTLSNEQAQVLIGGYTGSIPVESQLLVYGGNNGANIDARGKVERDEANIDLEGADWSSNPSSLGFSYYGRSYNQGSNPTMLGYDPRDLAQIRFNNVSTALITSSNPDNIVPIRFGINNIEIANISDKGWSYQSNFASANSANPRWLVDKAYADGLVSNKANTDASNINVANYKNALNISDGSTLNNNISGNSNSTTYWGLIQADFSQGSSDEIDYFVGRRTGDGKAVSFSPPQAKSALGLPSTGGYDLQSVTDRGATTTNPLTANSFTSILNGAETNNFMAYNNSSSNGNYSSFGKQFSPTDNSFASYIRFIKESTGDNYGSSWGVLTEADNVNRMLDYRIYVKNTNVGIGTTAPTAKLDVNGTFKTSGNATLSGQTLLGDATALTTPPRLDVTNGPMIVRSAYNNSGIIIDPQVNYIGFGTLDGSTGSVTAKNIVFANQSGSNIGIGNSNPSAKVDVTGSIRASANDGNTNTVVRNGDLGNYVNKSSNESIGGVKTFSSPITVTADPVTNFDVIRVRDLATQGKETAVNVFSSSNTTFTIVDSTFGNSTNLAVYVDASTAAVNIILPSVSNTTGKKILIFKTDSSANAVTINGPGALIYINGSPTYTLTSQYASVEIHANSTQYYAK